MFDVLSIILQIRENWVALQRFLIYKYSFLSAFVSIFEFIHKMTAMVYVSVIVFYKKDSLLFFLIHKTAIRGVTSTI